MKLLLLVVALTEVRSSSHADMDMCTEAVPCSELTAASGLTFNCRMSGPVDGLGVILLHGFPEWSRFWIPLMEYWVESYRPYRAVACDLRGYSPKAAPPNIDAYHYDHLANDVFDIADAVGFSEFHLAGHDHGAALGWFASTHAKAAGRVLSYSALTVPHPDVFSKAVYGAEADEHQQVASNYFNQFAQPDSATRDDGTMTLSVMMGFGGFSSPEDFQKALWWYNGSIGIKWARPPVLSDEVVAKYDMAMVNAVRKAMPLPVDAGAPPTDGPMGPVAVPTTFVCGALDPYLLCTRPSMTVTEEFVTAQYTYVSVQCSHGVLKISECESESELIKAMEGITAQIEQVSPSPPTTATTTPTATTATTTATPRSDTVSAAPPSRSLQLPLCLGLALVASSLGHLFL
eukprot:gnl/TRDRNA2_/TRDRNA2_173529_c1_seq1.p1 gnl/TRDRNA2_/TRDRNA2_173529_c1~~gnl/TRDRNA2_/TRDRNA2_173529_c1_seq1.p1  ORF type:complete len:403 (-),score=45.52 gnl/TRDRNA2_/TRDRNA2_173529_c1_seq1:25-1233(-)